MLAVLLLTGLAFPAAAAGEGEGDRPAVEAAPVQEPADSERAKWWNELSTEEQARWTERMERFRSLDPEARAELQRRFDAIQQERQALLEELDPARRRELELLPPDEQRRRLHGMLRERLAQRQESLEVHLPGVEDRFRGRPFSERCRESRRLLEEHRRPELLQELNRVSAEGWIGQRTLDWLQTAPLWEGMNVLAQVRKWSHMRDAHQTGLLDRFELENEQRRKLADMPPRDYFRAIWKLDRGEAASEVFRPRDRRWGGPDGRWDGSRRDGRRGGSPGDGPRQAGEGPPDGPPSGGRRPRRQ